MSTVDELKEQRAAAYHNLIGSAHNYMRAKKLLTSLEKRYKDDKELWESLDHQLALIDGRLKVVEPSVTKSHKVKEPVAVEDLNQDQINQMLAELRKQGYVVEVPTPDELAASGESLGEEDYD